MTGNDRTRRQLLAGVALAGGSGAVLGKGTGAGFADGELFGDSRITGGVLDLVVEWESGADSGSSEGAVPFALDLSSGNRSGAVTFAVSLPDDGSNNPAYGWLRTTCPEPTTLGEALEVTLSYADCGTGMATTELFSGSLRELADAYRNGAILSPAHDPAVDPGSQACLRPGEPLCLLLEWDLDDDYRGDESTDFALEFVGRQCRHGEGGTNPFPTVSSCDEPSPDRRGVSFVEIYACDGSGDACDCTRLGKLELEDDYCGQGGIAENYVEPGRRYDLYPDADGCGKDTGYDVRVSETTEKGDDGSVETTGIAFALLEDGTETGPDLCRVDVKGGPETITYDDPERFDGNETVGMLAAPAKGGFQS